MLRPASRGLVEGLGIAAVLLVGPVPLEALAAANATIALPSSAAGGTLAVYLQWPTTPGLDRYADGPPVVVAMLGGAGTGTLHDFTALADRAGFVVVQFVYPGGCDGSVCSGGTYDDRGPISALAARDVWRFALGRSTDSNGRTIHAVVGRPVLTAAMGIHATSNGTTITPVVLDSWPEEFVGAVRWISSWESVGSDQVRTSEIGKASLDCDATLDADGDGHAGNEGRNPRYLPERDYAYSEVAIDYSSLHWDPLQAGTLTDASGRCGSVTRNGLLYFDGNGNDRYDSRPLQPSCPDVDYDGLIEPMEDWPIQNPVEEWDAACHVTIHYSRPATRWLEAHPEIFPLGAWPAWVARLAQAEPFHSARAANDHLHRLAAYAAATRTITSFDAVPHYFVTADHLEARIEQDGLAASGLWRRIQPDASYYEAWNGSVPDGYPDAPAGLAPPVGQMDELEAPGQIDREELAVPAMMELADRTYFGGWVPQLDAVLAAPGVPAPAVRRLRFLDSETVAWDPAANNLFYDVIQGSVAALALHDGWVELGTTRCVADDLTGALAADSERPEAGAAWFYLVRPSGLSGTYGQGSAGEEREEGGGGCVR